MKEKTQLWLMTWMTYLEHSHKRKLKVKENTTIAERNLRKANIVVVEYEPKSNDCLDINKVT